MSKLQLSILIVLMLVSAGLNLRNYYLKSLLDEKAMEGALREGDDISSLRLFGKSSGGLGFSPGSAPSLLFIFSSDCRYSYQAVPFWKELQKSFSGATDES